MSYGKVLKLPHGLYDHSLSFYRGNISLYAQWKAESMHEHEGDYKINGFSFSGEQATVWLLYCMCCVAFLDWPPQGHPSYTEGSSAVVTMRSFTLHIYVLFSVPIIFPLVLNYLFIVLLPLGLREVSLSSSLHCFYLVESTCLANRRPSTSFSHTRTLKTHQLMFQTNWCIYRYTPIMIRIVIGTSYPYFIRILYSSCGYMRKQIF